MCWGYLCRDNIGFNYNTVVPKFKGQLVFRPILTCAVSGVQSLSDSQIRRYSLHIEKIAYTWQEFSKQSGVGR